MTEYTSLFRRSLPSGERLRDRDLIARCDAHGLGVHEHLHVLAQPVLLVHDAKAIPPPSSRRQQTTLKPGSFDGVDM